jgi:predicted kinase
MGASFSAPLTRPAGSSESRTCRIGLRPATGGGRGDAAAGAGRGSQQSPARGRRPLPRLVTGPPAGGKSSTARAVASELRVPFLSKDEFKERLYEVFGDEESLEARVEAAAMAILFSVAASQLRVGVPVVVESNFDARSDTAPLRALAGEHGGWIVQVHIGGPADAIVEKFARRAASGDRHPGHGDEPEDAETVRRELEDGRWEPLDLPGELIRAGLDADEQELATLVRDSVARS